MNKDEAMKLALEALECLYHGDTEHTYEALECGDAAIDAIKEALAQPEQKSTRPCRSCGGTGERHTGVDESPTTICKPCDGTGQIAMAEQPAQLAQPEQEPVMDYDKEELRGTVWDTNKQSLAQLEEDFCYCNDSISLQIVSGGAAVGGLYYRVKLKIDGEYVDYVRAQPEQEPVGSLNITSYKGLGNYDFDYLGSLDDGTYTLYTSPPKREWVGLTDDERETTANTTIRLHGSEQAYATAIEAKLKEKNHDNA